MAGYVAADVAGYIADVDDADDRDDDVDDDVTTAAHLLLGHLRRGPLSWAKILWTH
jgi:hypothetical protein